MINKWLWAGGSRSSFKNSLQVKDLQSGNTSEKVKQILQKKYIHDDICDEMLPYAIRNPPLYRRSHTIILQCDFVQQEIWWQLYASCCLLTV